MALDWTGVDPDNVSASTVKELRAFLRTNELNVVPLKTLKAGLVAAIEEIAANNSSSSKKTKTTKKKGATPASKRTSSKKKSTKKASSPAALKSSTKSKSTRVASTKGGSVKKTTSSSSSSSTSSKPKKKGKKKTSQKVASTTSKSSKSSAAAAAAPSADAAAPSADAAPSPGPAAASSSSSSSKSLPTITPFLYVPNLIGYGRVASLAAFGWWYKTSPECAIWMYMASMMLDAFDGMAARALRQSSKFGAVLDMVTDRVTTLCLMVVLSGMYPEHGYLYLVGIGLDIFSHWMRMYASLEQGSTSHKKGSTTEFIVLTWYYQVPYLMFVVCFLSEAYLVFLYVYANVKDGQSFTFFTDDQSTAMGKFFLYLYYTSAGVFYFKQATNIWQLLNASEDVVDIDIRAREALRRKKL